VQQRAAQLTCPAAAAAGKTRLASAAAAATQLQRQLKALGVLSHCTVLGGLHRHIVHHLCTAALNATALSWAAVGAAAAGWVVTAAMLGARCPARASASFTERLHRQQLRRQHAERAPKRRPPTRWW
jgi:hypothetical protein